MTTSIDHAAELARMSAEWHSITAEPDPVPHWEAKLARMQQQVRDLRASGQWKSGRKTLLASLGVHHLEVIMCRGLAWLLTPDAWHGIGSSVLDALLKRLDVATAGSEHASVVVEESRADTRADIIVRFGSTTILIEGKIWANEQPDQCDRLAHHWADEAPLLVFLTRDRRLPVTAIESRGHWHSLSWLDVADMVENVVADRNETDPGVLEYLRTLKIYGGNRP